MALAADGSCEFLGIWRHQICVQKLPAANKGLKIFIYMTSPNLCAKAEYSFYHLNQMNFPIWFTIFIIPTKWNSTSDLLFLLFEPNEFPHLIHCFYYSNQMNFHNWFTLSFIPTKWFSSSDLLFYHFNLMNFPINLIYSSSFQSN